MKTTPVSLLLGVLLFTACGQKQAAETTVASAPVVTPAPAALAVVPDNSLASVPPPPVPVEARIVEWKMRPSDIQEEMNHDRRVVRLKPPTDPLPQYARSEAMEGYIKQRLHADPVLAATDFRVDVERVVATLNGTADSMEQIGRAMAVVLGTEGISEVISELTLPETSLPAAASATDLPHG